MQVPTEVKFSVLGPVRAWRGDAVVDLGSPQQRALAAMLVLAAGRQVTLEAIVSGLWEGEPPLAATGTVRTYVSRLRRVLEPNGRGRGGDLIRSEGTGYVVPAGARLLDLETFDLMTRDARALAGRDPQFRGRAAALLGDAQELWQGEPLADVPGPYASSQRTRISELGLAAAEERLALGIELGGQVSAVAELRALLAAHPTRERLSELLMLALYRAGRQVEALTVFDDARRILAEEFGVDPGHGLRELHQRILHADKALLDAGRPEDGTGTMPGVPQGPAAVAATEDPVAVPAQLPGGLPAFAGRREDLGRLDSLLAQGPGDGVVIMALDGIAGIGKTTLAVQWAHTVASQYPDGQLYADLRGFSPGQGAVPPGAVLSGFLEALGADPARIPQDPRARAGLYRGMLRGRRVLVLLDNARDVDQVRPLLPASPGCLVIVTSRGRLTGLVTAHSARPVTLQPLSQPEAEQLLAVRIGKARLAAEPRALAEITRCCAGLPLALAVVAARAAAYHDLPLQEIAEQLDDPVGSLDALSTDDSATGARAMLSWSYQLLSEPARRLFRLLPVHGGPSISRDAAASLAGLPIAQVQPLIAELTGTGLLSEHRPGRLSVHEVTRAYAAELGEAYDSLVDRRQALVCMLDYYAPDPARTPPRPHQAVLGPEAPPPDATAGEITASPQATGRRDAGRRPLPAVVLLVTGHDLHQGARRLAPTPQQLRQRQGHRHDWPATPHPRLRPPTGAGDSSGQARAS
jgi:DNA-binding SARP family transcriptional activator